MTRTQAVNLILARLDTLPDDRIEVLAEVACAWDKPTVYSTLNDAERAELDAAVDEFDRGEGIPGELVFSELRQRIAAAKACDIHF